MPERSQLFIKRVMREPDYIAEMEQQIKQFLDEVEVEVNLMKGM
jgi:hypothetical protein